jgi:16S rRNA (adenine1518-N6/adenine1519-N6)-dimethyltransferase
MPLSPTATRDLLAQLGHGPNRRLGQNFLIDGNIVRKSLALAGVAPGDQVVEVGPGLGTLTSALLEAGAEVWAIEKDRTLHDHLAATLAAKFPATFHLKEGDAVEEPLAGWNGVRSMIAPSGSPEGAIIDLTPSLKIVANLPYAIATPWLDAVLSGPLPAHLVLMLQQEAAERYHAEPGSKSFGGISIFLQAAYAAAPGHKVAAACFYPPPEVESRLLHLVRRPDPFVFSPAARLLIRGCFQQRRKQIGALLRDRLPDGGAAWLELIGAAGYSSRTRPEGIPVELWMRLASLLSPTSA